MKEEERDNEAAAASALIAEPGWEPLEHLLALQTWDDEVGMRMRMVVIPRMIMRMRVVVILKMIMLLQSLGNRLSTSLPCRRGMMRLGMRMMRMMVVVKSYYG